MDPYIQYSLGIAITATIAFGIIRWCDNVAKKKALQRRIDQIAAERLAEVQREHDHNLGKKKKRMNRGG